MRKNNVLILSAGRRVELVQDFQTEAAKFSDDWENNLIMLRYDAKVLVHEND